jgi:hypothetical protein
MIDLSLQWIPELRVVIAIFRLRRVENLEGNLNGTERILRMAENQII